MRHTLMTWAAAIVMTASPALAWETLQGNGQFLVRKSVGQYTIEMKCERSMNNQLIFSVARSGGRNMPNVSYVAMWVRYGDGRMERRVVDVRNRGQYVDGVWFVSDLVLNEFRQAAGFEFEIGNVDRFTTDARGTGAARLAILEQCGF